MLDFLLNLLKALAVLTALLVIASMNVKRPRRVEQVWVPVVASVFAAISLILAYVATDRIDAFVETASSWIPFFPSSLSVSWYYIIFNVYLLLIFAVVKLALRPLFSTFFKKGGSISQFAVSDIYRFDSDLETWFIERRYSRVRDLYRALYWASAALAVLLVALALTFPDWPGFSTVAFPAIAAMVIGEFYFAVDGLTRDEYVQDVSGERDSARRVGNFGPLRSILTRAFPMEVLEEGVHLSSVAALDSGYRIGEMTRSTDPSTRLAGAYFDRLRMARRDVDVNYVGASADLLARSNVLFANPFHDDLSPYLCLPAYRELLERRRVLIIAGRDGMTEELVAWVDRGLQDITGIPGLWSVGVLEAAARDERHVGIIRSADLHNRELLINNDAFFSEVGLVIIAEPSVMLATGQVGIELVLERCSRDSMPPTVAAFDANHDGLVDTLSHLTKASFTEVVASALPQGACSELIWRSESPYMQTSILPGVARYLGVGTEISAVALKYDVSQVHWIGADSFPVVDMRWIAQQYFASINQFADLEMSQDALGDRVTAVANPWDLPQGENYFLVVEDSLRNAFETVRNYATRAKRAGFVNLISEEYLLRDYMVDNRDIFSVDSKAVPSLVPDYTRTERNVILRLLLTLRTFGMTEEELAKQLGILGWQVNSGATSDRGADRLDWEPASIGRLREGVEEFTGLRNIPLVAKTERGFLDDGVTTFYLHENLEVDEVIRQLAPAYFFVEDEVESTNIIGGLLLDHVFQALLPGQFVTYGGKYYEVHRMPTQQDHGRVVLRRAADHIRDRRVYRQLRHYSLGSLRPTDSVGAQRVMGDIAVTRAVADVTVESLGYMESRSRSDLESARTVLVDGIPKRHYRSKSVFVISIPSVPQDVRQTLATLLNEVFVTTFPYAYHYISALTPDSGPARRAVMPSLEVQTAASSATFDADSSIFIVEDSLIDLGLTAAVERNWERLLEIVTDYLDWVLTPIPAPPPPDERPPRELFPERPEVPEAAARKSRAARVWTWLRSCFGRRRSRGTKPVTPSARPEVSLTFEHDDEAVGESVTAVAPPNVPVVGASEEAVVHHSAAADEESEHTSRNAPQADEAEQPQDESLREGDRDDS